MIQAIKTIVSNSDGDEVDLTFEYGEDGMDVSKSEGGKINVKRIIELVMEAK